MIDKVYLCVKEKRTFECKKFGTFLEANKYYKDKYAGKESTVFTISKLVPSCFDNYIIHNKLSNLFIKC